MKKLIFTFLALATLQMNAAILVVKEYGVNATYSTIASALTAAVNNDTIVVYDKPSGQQWIENLTIDKNITFLHPTQGTRFKAPGNITIVPKAGMDLYLMGWDLNGNSIVASSINSTATLTNRAKISIGDCINVGAITLDLDGIEARTFYNTISGATSTVGGASLSGNIYYEQDQGNNYRRARVTTPVAHGLTEGALVTISGVSNPAQMNGTFSIIYVSSNQFYYLYNTTNTFSPNGANCTITPADGAGITFRHGLSVANVITNGGIAVNQETSTTSQNDSILVVGNKAKWCAIDTKEAGLVANNYFENTKGQPSNPYINGAGNALLIKNHNSSANAYFSVFNNTIINSATEPQQSAPTTIGLAFLNSTLNNVKISNNLIYSSSNFGGPLYGITTNNCTGLPFISHNYININGGSASNVCTLSFNNELNYTSTTANAYGSIDTWGRASSGNTNLINKGNYLGEYYDIDLTRNDIGTYGGPYSIDNYLTSGTGKGKVLYVNIKHQLTNLNQILNIKGSAGAKF